MAGLITYPTASPLWCLKKKSGNHQECQGTAALGRHNDCNVMHHPVCVIASTCYLRINPAHDWRQQSPWHMLPRRSTAFAAPLWVRTITTAAACRHVLYRGLCTTPQQNFLAAMTEASSGTDLPLNLFCELLVKFWQQGIRRRIGGAAALADDRQNGSFRIGAGQAWTSVHPA